MKIVIVTLEDKLMKVILELLEVGLMTVITNIGIKMSYIYKKMK